MRSNKTIFGVIAGVIAAVTFAGFAFSSSAQAAPATSATVAVNVVFEPTTGEKVVIDKVKHTCNTCSLIVSGTKTNLKGVYWIGLKGSKMEPIGGGSGEFTDLQLEVSDGREGAFDAIFVLHDKGDGEWLSKPVSVPACDYVPPTTVTTVKPTTTKPHHSTTTVPATTTTTPATSTTVTTAPTTTTTVKPTSTTTKNEAIPPTTNDSTPPTTNVVAKTPSGTLPVTGAATAALLLIATGLIGAGWCIKRLGGDDPIAA